MNEITVFRMKTNQRYPNQSDRGVYFSKWTLINVVTVLISTHTQK